MNKYILLRNKKIYKFIRDLCNHSFYDYENLQTINEKFNKFDSNEKKVLENTLKKTFLLKAIKKIETDTCYEYLKEYFKTVSYTKLAKDRNTTRQNTFQIVDSKLKNLCKNINPEDKQKLKEELEIFYKSIFIPIKYTKIDITRGIIEEEIKIDKKELFLKINKYITLSNKEFNSQISVLRKSGFILSNKDKIYICKS